MNNLTIRELMIQLINQISSRNEEQTNKIFETLKNRTGERFANADMWIGWYMKSLAKDEDKKFVETDFKLYIERKMNHMKN